MKYSDVFISLINSALYKKKAELPKDFDWEKVRKFIAAQELYELTYYGLFNSNLEIPEWLKTEFFSRVYLLTALWDKGERIIAAFKQKGIEHIPLKGFVVKDIYPEPYMRHMSDIDILIHEQDYKSKIRPVMLELGFTEGEESDHEYHWTKDGQTIELHKRIIPSYNKDFYGVVGDGWKWIKEGNDYAYIFAHFSKHYRDSGVGIVHFIDLEVCHKDADDKGINDLHLSEFYNNVERTLDCWFRNKEYDDVTRFITDKIFSRGEYGSKTTALRSDSLKKVDAAGGSVRKAKFKSVMRLIFPPLSVMRKRYKALKHVPVLLPIFWVWRIICSPFRGNIKKSYENAKAIKKDDYREELKYVGLDFWFK